MTTIMTWEVRELFGHGGTSPLPDISDLFDNIPSIYKEKQKATTRRVISVLKLRNSAFNPSEFELKFSEAGLSISLLDHSATPEIEQA